MVEPPVGEEAAVAGEPLRLGKGRDGARLVGVAQHELAGLGGGTAARRGLHAGALDADLGDPVLIAEVFAPRCREVDFQLGQDAHARGRAEK